MESTEISRQFFGTEGSRLRKNKATKTTILSHEEISHLFEPIQFFVYITERFSRSP